MKTLMTILGATVLLAASSQAATLAQYPFTGQSLASTSSNPNSTAADIVLDTGLTDATRFLAYGNQNQNIALRVNGDEARATFALSNANNVDFTLQITPDNGRQLTLQTLTFDTAVSAASVDAGVRIQLSTNGTTFTNLQTINDITSTAFVGQTVDLSPANTTLASGSPIYIRFLVTDTGNSATDYTAFDNILVTGTVPILVPEPKTNALLALGALAAAGVIVRARKRAKA